MSNLFQIAVQTIFDSWTGLQIAVTNGFGGTETKEKLQWFVDATYQWIIENEDLEDFELEQFFLDTMNTEFDTILDDNSEQQVAQNLIGAYNLYKSGQYAQLENEIAKLKQQTVSTAAKSSIKVETEDTESSSDEDDDMDEDNEESDANSNRKANIDKEMESVEEGWTYVSKGGKQFTK